MTAESSDGHAGANKLAGNATKEFGNLNVKISLTSVVVGERFVVSESKTAPRIIIPCECVPGSINVESLAAKIEQTLMQAAAVR